VESENYLGIYISKDTATVACVDSGGKAGGIVGCFSVSADGQAEAAPHVLASLISQGCAERDWEFSEVAVALDCAMFMQHNVHSEFSDTKQIAATIRFDAEEALATDVTDVAIAFQVTSSEQEGSELTVFTAQKKILSDVILSLQSNGVDPMSIEPDVNCLSRFVGRKVSEQAGTLFGVLSGRSGYLIAPSGGGAGPQKGCRVRTFLVGSTKDRNGLLAREALMSTALTRGGEQINRVKVFDSAGTVDCQQLGERLGVEAGEVDLARLASDDAELPADCADTVGLAIACGAALAHLEKAPLVNFREDFMPYQGKKVRMRKTLRYLSVSVTVLLIAVGLYFQTQLFGISKYRGRVRDKLAADYSTVLLNQKLGDMTLKGALGRLNREKNKVAQKTRIDLGDESISSKLTQVLDAFNKCAAKTRLNIESVSISTKNIVITGDTSSRSNTLHFRNTLKASGLEVVKETLNKEPNRDKFIITVEQMNK